MAEKNSENFSTYYVEFCKRMGVRPLPIICVSLPYSLDFTTDRIKIDDWGPILSSISLDKSLKSISIRSRFHSRKPLEEINSEGKARALDKAPVVLTRYLLECLSHSVAQCIRNSPTLTRLELEGIPLPMDCLGALCVGLSNTETLKHLSLKRCYIGDSSCELICRTVADVQSIRSLNLSQCDLTCKSGPSLASALSRQKLLLYHDTWKDSLRYRQPDVKSMAGLRRLTLNGNSQLGDTAVIGILDSIHDNLWIKALDLQYCGLTNAIEKKLFELLDHNKTINVIDIRCNPNLDDNILADVLQHLEINNEGRRMECKFLNIPTRGYELNERCKLKQKNLPIKNHLKRSLQSTTFPAKRIPNAVTNNNSNNNNNNNNNNNKRSRINLSKNTDSDKNLTNDKSAKVFLRLDLQSEIQSVKDQKKDNNNLKEIIVKDNNKKLNDFLKQLSDVKVENERLEEELNAERLRREVSETKLLTIEKDLKCVMKNNNDTPNDKNSNYLMINSDLINEISDSFEKLLCLIDTQSDNNSTGKDLTNDDERCDALREKLNSLIRKTKSEKLNRELIIDDDDQDKFKSCKSEADVSNNTEIIGTLELTKDIGDHKDYNNKVDDSKKYHDNSSCEKARAIFAQIVNSDVILNLGSYVS